MYLSVTALLAALAISGASPIANLEARTVTALNPEATAEAQQRDNTATRAVTASPIKTSNGKCLLVNPLSGDFRENLTPIQVADCDGSQGQDWDVITSGKHNNVPGSALIVSSLTNACFNFDPRRAAGNQVLLFSCGGRADGSGKVTNSQLFPFNGSTQNIQFKPENQEGSCFTVKGNVLDIATCNAADSNQVFSFGNTAPAAGVNQATATTSAATQATSANNAACSA